MKKKGIVLSILCIYCLLASLVFSGCNDMPSKEEIARILSIADPSIEEALSSAYGFTPGTDYLSEGTVGHSRMAEYKFELNGTQYEAFVDTGPEEPVVYTNYYEEDFRNLFEGIIFDAISGVDLLSGSEVEVNHFYYSDDTARAHNPRYVGSGNDFPTFVTPDNLVEYIKASDESPLSFDITLYYYNPSDFEISEEKFNSVAEKFDLFHEWNIDLYHYGFKNNNSPKNLREEYYISSYSATAWHEKYVYFDLADGVILRSNTTDNSDFEYHYENNILHTRTESPNHYRLFIDYGRMPDDKKYYEIQTDSEGKKRRVEHNWYHYDCFLNTENEFPLK